MLQFKSCLSDFGLHHWHGETKYCPSQIVPSHHRDNIERVQKDEEEAWWKEEHKDSRMMLAVSFYDSSYPTWFKGSVQ